jgi:hypothetical protein
MNSLIEAFLKIECSTHFTPTTIILYALRSWLLVVLAQVTINGFQELGNGDRF